MSGITDPKLAAAFNDWMQCMRDYEEKYRSLMTGYKTPFLGLIPKEKTQSTGFKPKKKGCK